MNDFKRFTLAAALAPVFITSALADTAVLVQVTNNTSNTLRLKYLSVLPPDYPTSGYDVSPHNLRNINIPFQRTYTYPTSGWQPTLRKVSPVQFDLTYEVNGHICQLATRLEVPIIPGWSEPSYAPHWSKAVNSAGNNNYSCNAVISQKMPEVPFNYTIKLTIDENNPT
ncbi:hypothetical protein OC610_12410 [Pseudomonas sp. SAICEU22]|uniref:Uncharacterized protein n=1 Tax=Pseudomonas agronomica TaxID=2979328 RepID=A0ABT3F7Y2_9PSED|nr:hypothetical protein [Pseudomonas agronomica]MCW1245211.1 hypothetical protein [Pseudomonas agronomica]